MAFLLLFPISTATNIDIDSATFAFVGILTSIGQGYGRERKIQIFYYNIFTPILSKYIPHITSSIPVLTPDAPPIF
jgi:hypothetical protein